MPDWKKTGYMWPGSLHSVAGTFMTPPTTACDPAPSPAPWPAPWPAAPNTLRQYLTDVLDARLQVVRAQQRNIDELNALLADLPEQVLNTAVDKLRMYL